MPRPRTQIAPTDRTAWMSSTLAGLVLVRQPHSDLCRYLLERRVDLARVRGLGVVALRLIRLRQRVRVGGGVALVEAVVRQFLQEQRIGRISRAGSDYRDHVDLRT